MRVGVGWVQLYTAQPAEVGVTPPAGHLVTSVLLLYRGVTVRTVLCKKNVLALLSSK